MIRTIIIDDEPSAVNLLSLLLSKQCQGDVEVLATSCNPHEGRDLIEKYAPDLVFLDIEMPGMSGIELIHSFPNPRFQVVFVTAYDSYAIEAFKLNAVDYLLKPIMANDVVKAVEKIKSHLHNHPGNINFRLGQLEKMLFTHHQALPNKIGIGMSDKIVYVNIQDILFCEAKGSYTEIHLKERRKILTSKLLGDFEAQLNGHCFFRIHHHYLINLSHVKEFQRHDGGYVIMENDKHLEVAQRKRKEFLEAMQNIVL